MTEPKRLAIVTMGKTLIADLDRITRMWAEQAQSRGVEVSVIDIDNQPLRGNAPDLLIIDDIVDEQQTPEQRQAVWDWMVSQYADLAPQIAADTKDLANAIRHPDRLFADKLEDLTAREIFYHEPVQVDLGPEVDNRPHWQKLNGGDRPWQQRRKGKRK